MTLPHAKSGEIVKLNAFATELRDAHTTALVKNEKFEAIRLIVHAGSEIQSHQVGEMFTLQCLEGRVRLVLADGHKELSAGQWIYFNGGVAHSVEGIEDSSLLLTILFDDSHQ